MTTLQDVLRFTVDMAVIMPTVVLTAVVVMIFLWTTGVWLFRKIRFWVEYAWVTFELNRFAWRNGHRSFGETFRHAIDSSCPACLSREVPVDNPRTLYECGSSIYDRDMDSFRQSEECKRLVSEVDGIMGEGKDTEDLP